MVAPYWAIAGVLGVLPLAWAVHWRLQRGRVKAGCCVACGYDLRATPERCPECGAVPIKT